MAFRSVALTQEKFAGEQSNNSDINKMRRINDDYRVAYHLPGNSRWTHTYKISSFFIEWAILTQKRMEKI